MPGSCLMTGSYADADLQSGWERRGVAWRRCLSQHTWAFSRGHQVYVTLNINVLQSKRRKDGFTH